MAFESLSEKLTAGEAKELAEKGKKYVEGLKLEV